MRISRLLLATVAAVLCFAVVAVAQTGTYTVNGSVTVHGGSKKHPKPGGLTFGFDVADKSGPQPAPIKDYQIGFEGGRMNLNIMKSCTAAKINATNQGDDSKCPKGSEIGHGTLSAAVGATGQPIPGAAACTASLTLYAAGHNAAALFVKATLANCPAEIHEAIPMTYFTDRATNVSGLKFTVPDDLRHQLGLDVTVVSTKVTLPKIVRKVKHGHHKKKVGLLESTGCKDNERDVIVTFTDEQGNSFPVTQPIGKC